MCMAILSNFVLLICYRTRNFWLKKSPQGKLVWYNDFYVVDQTVVYESPSAANVPIINVPSSIFVFPFWNNDME